MKRIAVFLLAVLAAEIVIYGLLSSFEAKRIDVYYEQQMLLAQNSFNSAVSSFDQIFKNILKDKLDVDEAKALIHDAYVYPSNRDKYRNWLRIYTKPVFDSLKSVGLTHLHFHLPDGTSFLRMHRPFYYGDDLSFRKGIRDANSEKEPVKGFENGRHLLAYRFIFPLEYEGEHIGTVEMAVGLHELIEIMNRLYGLGYAYLLEKDKVFRNYTATAAEVYEKYSISDDYIMELCDACIQKRDPACALENINEDMTDAILGRDLKRIKSFETFAEISPINDRVIYSFMPIVDLNGTGMGYLISHSIVNGYTYIKNTYKALFIFISLCSISIICIFFALDYSRRKTAEVNVILEHRVAEKVQELRDKEQFFAQQSKMVTMGEMLGSILHQWKQPINSISLIADLLLFECTQKGGDEEVHSSLYNIRDQARFMSQTGEDFRNFMKPSKEKVIFNVADSVCDVIRLFEFSFTRYGIGFEKEWNTDSRPVADIYGYPNEFKHVLLNIFNNARDAIVQLRELMVEKGEDVSEFEGIISINLEMDDESVIVRIADTGGGIPENVIDRIFDKYFTTKNEEGSGIGLYMSKEMVETSMGGSMTVKNIAGGAEFSLIFPKPRKEDK